MTPKQRAATVDRILEQLEKDLATKKPATIADSIRLIQFLKEMQEEKPKSIQVMWVDSEEKSGTNE